MSNMELVPPCEKTVQGRNWAYLAYPDSMQDDLFKHFEDSCNSVHSSNKKCIYVSPLHDKDIFENGEPKKPHYHILVCYTSDITIQGAQKFGLLNGLVGCEKVLSKKKYARYLCHLDEKDKILYEVSDVKSYGEKNYIDVIGSTEDKFKVIREMIMFINEMDFVFFSDFVTYTMENNDDWFRFLMSGGTYQIEKYIKERRCKMQYNQQFSDYFKFDKRVI